MIRLHRDEKIVGAFEVKKSPHGGGVFYITDFGACFESRRYGIVVEAGFERLRSYSAVRKDVFQIVWSSQNNERFSYEMEVDSAEEVMASYKDANSRYAWSMTEIQALRSGHAAKAAKGSNRQH